MKVDKITVGTKLDFYTEEFIVKDYNGSIVYGELYELDDNDNMVLKESNHRLTKNDIADKLREVDGHQHKIIWEEVEEA